MEKEIKKDGAEQSATPAKSEQTTEYSAEFYQHLRYFRAKRRRIFMQRMMAEEQAEQRAFFWAMGVAVVAYLIFNVFFYFLIVKPVYNDDPEMPPFHFIPNSIAYAKPTYVQMIKTQEQLDLVKKANVIRDYNHEASIGAAVAFTANGLEVWSKDEIHSQDYHLKDVGFQKDRERMILDYRFQPDTMLTRDPLFVEVLENTYKLEISSANKDLLEREMIEPGSAIYCPKTAKCFVIPKVSLKYNYRKVTPIVSSMPTSDI